MSEDPSDKVELARADGASRGFYDLKNRINDLTGKEWVFCTKSVIPRSYPPSFQLKLRNAHGGQKPPELCAEIVQAFTKRGQVVLDPFAGVGGTLLGCSICGRVAIGIEINKEWTDIYHQVCALGHVRRQAIVHGDASCLVPAFRFPPADMVLTDIPYWNMDKVEKSRGTFKRAGEAAKGVYSDKSKLGRFDDEGPQTKDEWLAMLRLVFAACHGALKNKGYAAVFVGNMYNKGEFHYLTADVAGVLKAAGFVFKGEIIWYDVAKKLHLYGINYEWIPSMVHQSILVFQKDEGSAGVDGGAEFKAQNRARLNAYQRKKGTLNGAR
ncbi:MAG: class I SAM-dependent methyltransferase [Candidatus Lokiarchaeota archaeon]|nr:class I SAM-dependent methyltransferase [Candidatus Lokiarchaeota archaeon]